jgi:hypothetical protein
MMMVLTKMVLRMWPFNAGAKKMVLLRLDHGKMAIKMAIKVANKMAIKMGKEYGNQNGNQVMALENACPKTSFAGIVFHD